MTPSKTPTLIWGADTIGSNAGVIPRTARVLWPYRTGSSGVAWTPQQAAEFPDATAIWVTQEDGDHVLSNVTEYDIERGAWTVNGVIDAVRTRQDAKMVTTAYVTWADYGRLKQGLAEIGIDRNVWYRIADWNLDQHLADVMLHGDIYAGQWASPTSNPLTLLPGTKLTLAEANCDLNVAFLPLPAWQD